MVSRRLAVGPCANEYDLFSPLLAVTDETVRAALALDVGRLGANDRIHLAVCRAADIDAIVTADAGFDQALGVKRIDPLDGRRLARLLRSRCKPAPPMTSNRIG